MQIVLYYPGFVCQVSSGNFTAMPEINSKITIKTPEQRQWPRSGTFIINFEQI